MHRILFLLLAGSGLFAQSPLRPVHTYSIVARDSITGDLGVAVQSHYFSVGGTVPWAEAGVGAVATQSFVETRYGRGGLDLMRQGYSAPAALKELLAADKGRDVRQVAMVDASGRVGSHTGPKCIQAAGQEAGEGFSVQANLMGKPSVWPAMAKAFREAKGDLADRMLAALRAAEEEGGDIRGRQSAAILIVRGKASLRPWDDRIFDLRVEDHPAPVEELTRLVRLRRAYLLADQGDAFATEGKWNEATAAYESAVRLAPQIVELPFWHAVALVNAKRLEEALPLFKAVFIKDPAYRQLLRRLVQCEQLPNDTALMARIESQ